MRVFISYSWDSDEHKERISNLVSDLRNDGIGAEYDGDIMLGERIPLYMETRVSESDFVVFICTPMYKQKADSRLGGVGYESNIITSELYSMQNERKFLPVLFSGTWDSALPTWAAGKSGLDFTSNIKAKSEYLKLVQHLNGNISEINRVPFAQKPTLSSKSTSPSIDAAESSPIRILRIITEEVGFPKNDGTRGCALYAIPFELSRYPSGAWGQLFVQSWNHPPRWTTMHRPGIARVSGKKIVLDGTTIEEVKSTHRETLLLAVQEANEKEQQILQKMAIEAERKRVERESHLSNIDDISLMISFDD